MRREGGTATVATATATFITATYITATYITATYITATYISATYLCHHHGGGKIYILMFIDLLIYGYTGIDLY